MPSPDLLSDIAARHGTPCFVYDVDAIVARVARVRAAFGNRMQISYAVKSNPNTMLLTRLRTIVDRIDVSSGGEVLRGEAAGWPTASMSFTGPAKRDPELRLAVERGVGDVVVESLSEAQRLDAIAARHGVTQPILVRIAPARLPRGFGVNMAGKPTQFGIDEEVMDDAIAAILRLPHLSIHGFHIYSGTQCLRPDSLVENYGIFAELFRRACRGHGIAPRRLIFGSGIGIPYYDGDEAVDIDTVGKATVPLLDGLRAEVGGDLEFILETGRYLVGEAGTYLTSVIGVKHSRGHRIAICDGGMNHHLGAAGHLGTVIHRNYRMFALDPGTAEAAQTYDVVGPLCTTIDTLGKGVKLPELGEGSIIAIHCSGAYGPTASPVYFISHPVPKEIMIETAGNDTTVTNIDELPRRD